MPESTTHTPPQEDAPAHAALATVFQVRGERLEVLLWQRGREPFKGAWSLPGGALGPDETLEASILRHLATKVDVREVAHLEQLGNVERSGPAPGALGSRRRTSGSSPSESTRGFPRTRAGIPSTTCPIPRSTTAPSRWRGESGCGAGSPTRTSASRSRPRPSRSRSCATSTRPRSGTTFRDESQARARPARRDRDDRPATRARPVGRAPRGGVPLPDVTARGDRPLRGLSPAVVGAADPACSPTPPPRRMEDAVKPSVRPLRSSLPRLRPISRRMRHFRLWLLVIGALSLVAEAIAAAALFWRGPTRRTVRS